MELIFECAELSGVGGYISSSHVVNANVTINSNTLIHKLQVVDDEAVSCDALLGLDFLNLLTHTKSGSTLQYEPLLSHNNEPSTIESILNLVVDFRALNKITVKDRYPLTLIDDQVDRLSGSTYFTTLDMAAGFHQIPVHPDSIEKLAFVTSDGQYEYLRMPFGLANAPSIYQRAINTALQSEIQEGIALVYLDDVLIPSTTVKKGLANLRKVLTTLQSHGFSINVEKCSFLQTEVEYLGRVISNGEVKPSPSKANVLKAIKPSMNVKEVRQFLGLAGYFRKLIPQFSVKTRVLSTLLKHDAVWQWSQKHTDAFNYVVNILASEPVLTIFNPSLPTELHTDASSKGFGAIIIPIHDD
jgi:hypothetical protein